MKTKPVFISSISMKDVDRLTEIFAYLTESGWVIPLWVLRLREYVLNRTRT